MTDKTLHIQGYPRPDGSVGIRNHVLVIPTSVCASVAAMRIAEQVTTAVALPHQHGCCQMGIDYQQTLKTLIGIGSNPNVGAVLVISLGCDGLQPEALVKAIRAAGKTVHSISIQQSGGTTSAIEKGISLIKQLADECAQMPRCPVPIGQLILALECGGSDATSGLASNPVAGAVTDKLIDHDGAVILSETTELIGAEHIMAQRAVNDQVARKLIRIVERMEQRGIDMGVDIRGSQPTPGNIQGGLTTIEEKSLGCIAKAGTARLQDVIEYAEPPRGKGLYVMDTPGQDIESIAGMTAGGAQLVLFTTGSGTPSGSPIAPVIKITGNAETAQRMVENIDFDASEIVTDRTTVAEAGDRLWQLVIDVCNGKLTRAEQLGHHEFAIYRIGYTL